MIDDIPTHWREPRFAESQQMPIFSICYQREVRLIQPLRSGQHFALPEYGAFREGNYETAIHLGMVSHSARPPSVDYVPGDSIRAVADALEASPNFTLSKFRSNLVSSRERHGKS